jgi:hypothetical protein
MHLDSTMWSPTLKTTCRLAAAVSVLFVLEHWYGQRLIEMLLPLLQSELYWVDDNYRILKLSLTTQGSDSVIRLDVALARFVVVGMHVIAPDPRGHAVVTTLASSVLRPLIIGLALLAAWPVQRMLQYLWRFGIGVLLLLVVLPLDVPFVLLGEVWELLRMAKAQNSFSLLISWKNFLQDGGRLALALCAAIVAIGLAQRLSPPRLRPVGSRTNS